MRLALVVGGLSLKAQEAEMRSRPDIVVATPGRLIDLLRNAPSVGLEDLEILVLDEADRLLELGFVPGTGLRVVRRVEVGDVIEIELRTSRVSLRISEADVIEVEPRS